MVMGRKEGEVENERDDFNSLVCTMIRERSWLIIDMRRWTGERRRSAMLRDTESDNQEKGRYTEAREEEDGGGEGVEIKFSMMK